MIFVTVCVYIYDYICNCVYSWYCPPNIARLCCPKIAPFSVCFFSAVQAKLRPNGQHKWVCPSNNVGHTKHPVVSRHLPHEHCHESAFSGETKNFKQRFQPVWLQKRCPSRSSATQEASCPDTKTKNHCKLACLAMSPPLFQGQVWQIISTSSARASRGRSFKIETPIAYRAESHFI